MLMYYCYRHIRVDKNVPFYIGIGTIMEKHKTIYSQYGRMNVKCGRNLIWKKIVAKTEYCTEVIFESENLSEILNKEKEFISLYGRRCNGGVLCNLTDGGDGVNNLDEEKRRKITEFNRGSKRSLSSIEKMRAAKEKNSRKVIHIETGVIYNSCTAAEIALFKKKNQIIHQAMRRSNGVMKNYNMSFKYI